MATALRRYDLRSWVNDLSVGYALSTGGDWALTPRVGVTFMRTIRDRAVETGSIFGVTVARDRHDAIFRDAGAPLTLVATGAQRATMVGTVSAGLFYRLTRQLGCSDILGIHGRSNI